MGRFNNPDALPDVDKIFPLLLERYPGKEVHITVTGTKLQELEIPVLTDLEFAELLKELKQKFPGAFPATQLSEQD